MALAINMKKALSLVGILLPLTTLEMWILTCQEPFRIKCLRIQLNIVIGVVMFVCSRYVWSRLNILIRTKSIFTFGALFKILIFILMVLAQVAIVCGLMVRTDPPLLSSVAAFSLGSIMLLTFCMIVADICSFVCRKLTCILYGKSRASNSFDAMEIKIRSLLSLISALILIVAGTFVVNNLTVEQVTVPIEGLGSQLNGTTIVQVSDLHLGPFNGKSRLSSIVEKVNQLNGDIVVITGDLVDSSVETLREAVVPLKRLKAKYGSFFITGLLN